MNEFDITKYISKVDPVELLLRAEEAKKYLGENNLDEEKIENTLAYALAAGVKLGVKAVLENIESK